MIFKESLSWRIARLIVRKSVLALSVVSKGLPWIAQGGLNHLSCEKRVKQSEHGFFPGMWSLSWKRGAFHFAICKNAIWHPCTFNQPLQPLMLFGAGDGCYHFSLTPFFLFLVSLFLRKKTVVTVVHRERSTRKELDQQFKEHHKVVSFLQTHVKRNHQASVRSSPDDGASAHSVMVMKIPWKPFWLATQLSATHDWAGWQRCVNYMTYPHRPHMAFCI